MGTENTRLGAGIYSVPEASRLLHLPSDTIRRWLHGYTRPGKGGLHSYDRIWSGDYERIEAVSALSFLDLMEARFVGAFRKAGCRWNELRRAHVVAQRDVGHSHPFCTRRFVTDGHRILRELRGFGHAGGLDEILSRQRVFEEFTRPILVGLEFDGDTLTRWRPLGEGHAVVVDPTRAFGRPVVDREGVPTDVLAAAVSAGNSLESVREWYGVKDDSLRDAIEFERQTAA